MSAAELPAPSALARYWDIEPDVVFLNHGSFGACPRAVLARQSELRAQMEGQLMRFFLRELGELQDQSRRAISAFVGADPEGLVFVPNATTAVNSVLRSYDLRPGDELLTTDHAYAACKNALEFVADRAGARVVVAHLPFPTRGPDEVLERVLGAVTERTRLCMLDHITSPTGLCLPIERLVAELEGRGVDTLVDGAHAPGMIELDLRAIGAAWYTGNCHKWMCTPKGSAILYVREDKRASTRPLAISHAAGHAPGDCGDRLHAEFDWTGTDDPTPWLSIPAAIAHLDEIAGGWDALRAHNRQLALRARDLLCNALDVPPPCPDEMIGTLAAVPLPPAAREAEPDHFGWDPLQRELAETYRVEVPVMPAPEPAGRVIRVACQLYNSEAQYAYLAELLPAVVGR